MPKKMYDSTNANSVPTDGDLYAGYVGGNWPTYFDFVKRFPDKPVISIAVASSQEAVVLDVERGDAPPELAPVWVTRRRNEGKDPTVYCAYSEWPVVRKAFADQFVVEPHWWIALYDNLPSLEEGIYLGHKISLKGIVAKQYGGDRFGNWDISIVSDDWPNNVPVPRNDDEELQWL